MHLIKYQIDFKMYYLHIGEIEPFQIYAIRSTTTKGLQEQKTF